MDKILLFFTAFTLIWVNIWHGLLIVLHRQGTRPDTISEHAAATSRNLLLHRIFHTIGGVLLVIFAVGFLVPHGYVVAAMLIGAGGIFDAVQALALKKRTARMYNYRSLHQLAAWPMALCYLAYAMIVARATGVSLFVVHGVWILFLVLLGLAIATKFRRFWILQMGYFIFLAITITVAHIQMLSW